MNSFFHVDIFKSRIPRVLDFMQGKWKIFGGFLRKSVILLKITFINCTLCVYVR